MKVYRNLSIEKIARYLKYRMLTWASVFFCPEVLNDSCSVLLLLKAKFSGGVLDDGRTETTDHCLAPGWGGVWKDSGTAPAFHQHGEVILSAAQPGGEVGSLSLRAVRQAD